MDYIISEEELRKYLEAVTVKYNATVLVKDFLKSKTPVEVIAEGKIRTDIDMQFIGSTYISIQLRDKLEKHNSKKGKLIWVEEIE